MIWNIHESQVRVSKQLLESLRSYKSIVQPQKHHPEEQGVEILPPNKDIKTK